MTLSGDRSPAPWLASSRVTELGACVGHHQASNRRRALTAAVAVVVGAVVFAFGVLSFLILDFSRAGGAMLVAGMILGSGIGLLLMGINVAVQAVRRRGETFTLHENGFVHTRGRTTTIARWTDVETVTDLSKDNPLARMFGGDVGGVVRLVDGRKVLINGFTEGAARLWSHIVEATRCGA